MDVAHEAAGASRTARKSQALTLRVPAEPLMLRHLRASLRAWLRRLRWPQSESVAIIHAVDEACTNVIEHAYAFDGAGEIDVTGREHKDGLRRHVVIDVLDQGRWLDTSDVDANGMTLMRGLVHRVNVHARPDGTRVSLISCAVPQPGPRSDDVRHVDPDRVARALEVAAAHCERARLLADSALTILQAGRLRRQARVMTRT